ncbi:DUF2911 domain-containing protein [Ferruginibacter sp.]
MKKMITAAILAGSLFISCSSNAQQDKSKRPSPPALVKETINTGATISIDYSQPSVKGRTIGTDLEPKEGQVWRTGANEATVFETDKDLKFGNATLPAGKYGLFSLSGKDNWTIIFNKTWKQWGAFDYKQADDALRITAKAEKSTVFTEKMTFTIDKSGLITLLWGDNKVTFTAQ